MKKTQLAFMILSTVTAGSALANTPVVTVPAATTVPTVAPAASGTAQQPIRLDQNTIDVSGVTQPNLGQNAGLPTTTTNNTKKILQSASGVTLEWNGALFVNGSVKFDGADDGSNYSGIKELPTDGKKPTRRFGVDEVWADLTIKASKELDGKVASAVMNMRFDQESNSKSKMFLRRAYLNYDKWLLGRATTEFYDGSFQPSHINSDLGAGGYGAYMLRYSDRLDDKTKYSIAVEQPLDPDYRSGAVPNVVGRIQSEFNDKTYGSLRGFVGQTKDNNRKDYVGSGKKATSWGVGIGASHKPTDKLTVWADYSHVKGDGNYMGYANSPFTLDRTKNKLVVGEFDDLMLGASYTPMDKVTTVMSYAQLQSKAGDFARLNPDQNKRLQQAAISVWYNFVPPINIATEFSHGKRTTYAGKTGSENMINFYMDYSF
ncbi:DcaP family trimeric outer membrane transporter [Acinetobacter sp. c1-l78]|uniref:DcaP family trimeric outer membrane transporter n=1 Tax=Acinetobacter sp. c1-l78 TaxID=3342803 RepID=UPI0035B6C29B